MKRFIFFIMVVLFLGLSLYGYNDDFIKNDNHLLSEEMQRFDNNISPKAVTADSLNTYLVGRYYYFGVTNDMFIVDSFAYVCAGKSLVIMDISDKTKPTVIGYYDTNDNAMCVYVVGDYAYVAEDGYLRIIDVSDPTNPAEVGYCVTYGYERGVYVVGDYAYVTSDYYDDGYYKGSLHIIDISDPTNPTEVGYYDMDGVAYGVYVVGDYAYVANHTDGLRIIDVSDKANPTEVGLL